MILRISHGDNEGDFVVYTGAYSHRCLFIWVAVSGTPPHPIQVELTKPEVGPLLSNIDLA